MTPNGRLPVRSPAAPRQVLVNPFRNILKLAAGDFLAKTLYFLTFVYLARILGVRHFGLLEFANSLVTYFLLISDAGLERWSVRELAQTGDVRALARRVVPLRLLFAGAAFALMLLSVPLLPGDPLLRQVLILFGLSLFPQAASLKWVFMGEQKMNLVAAGLVIGQVVFALGVFAIVHAPEQLVWVPVLRIASDVALASYFAWRFVREHGGIPLPLVLRGARSVLGPALTLGLLHALAIINYSFDTVFLGFMAGATTVGWYSAAYKPVTVALAMPLTYFAGLFPAVSRAYAEDKEALRGILSRSLRLATSLSVPVGVGGAMLAEPIILILFGPAYQQSVPVLRILIWSVVLVILRGTFHQALNAAKRSAVDLRCAIVSAGLNVALNFLLIPHYGMIGAACATLFAETVWVALVANRVNHYVIRIGLSEYLWRPALAGAVMATAMWATSPLFWVAHAALGVGTYFLALFLLGGVNWREWKSFLGSSAS